MRSSWPSTVWRATESAGKLASHTTFVAVTHGAQGIQDVGVQQRIDVLQHVASLPFLQESPDLCWFGCQPVSPQGYVFSPRTAPRCSSPAPPGAGTDLRSPPSNQSNAARGRRSALQVADRRRSAIAEASARRSTRAHRRRHARRAPGQRVALAGDDIHHAGRHVRGLQHLIEIGGRQRMPFRSGHTTRLPIASGGATAKRNRAAAPRPGTRCRSRRAARASPAPRRAAAAYARRRRTCRPRRRT